MTNLQTISEWLISAKLKASVERANLIKLEEELRETEIYKNIQDQKNLVKVMEDQITESELSIKNGLISQGIKSIEAGDYKFTVKTAAGWLVISDDELVPDEYKKEKTTITIDKKAIKDDIKSGKEINGCNIGEWKTSLLISKKNDR